MTRYKTDEVIATSCHGVFAHSEESPVTILHDAGFSRSSTV